MRTRRFLSVFFVLVLVLQLLAVSALADDSGLKEVEDPDIQARAALLVDVNTDTVLYDKNMEEEMYPASLTKIMTALLVLEAVDRGELSMDTEITAPESAFDGLDSAGSTANIKAGEILTVEELLTCMLVVSANETCNILAETLCGSVDAFVDRMNQRAQELGCQNTHFVNATGLHDPQHYTSAWDLYLIAKEALTHEDFLTICDMRQPVIPATNLSAERTLHTTNSLLDGWRALGYRYKYAHGVKTGSTSDAGHCLVSTAEKGELHLVSVVLGAEKVSLPTGGSDIKSFSETRRLFEWGFDNFSYQTILTAEEMLASMPVTLSEIESVALHSAEDIVVLMPDILSAEDLTRTIRFRSKSVEAPVSAGDQLAEVELSYNGTVYATVPLAALADVEASRSLVLKAQIRAFFDRTIVKVICVIVLALIVFLVGWKLTIGRQRYRYGKNVRRQKNYRGRRRGL